MGEIYKWEDKDECRNAGRTLGQLQGMILKKKITKATTKTIHKNAYYMGIELENEFPKAAEVRSSCGGYYLKWDVPGEGSGNRPKNRAVVLVDENDNLVEGKAWLWRHDDRVLELTPIWFKAGSDANREVMTGRGYVS
jgi:hypothetical protein